jgi:hypothetical protein
LQDHVFQPFEDLLRYEDFSIRLPAADIPRIQELLQAVSDDEWKRMHNNLMHVHKVFMWDQAYGGLAYNYTIASLRRRAQRLQAGLIQE